MSENDNLDGGFIPFPGNITAPPAGVSFPGTLLPGSPPTAVMTSSPGALDQMARNMPNMPRVRGLMPFGMMSGINGLPLSLGNGLDIGMMASYPGGPNVFHNTAIDRFTGVANTPGNSVGEIDNRLRNMTGMPQRRVDPNLPVVTETSVHSETAKENDAENSVSGAGILAIENHNGEAVVILSKKGGDEFNDLGLMKEGNRYKIAKEAVKDKTNSILNLDMYDLTKDLDTKSRCVDISLDGKKYSSFVVGVPHQNLRRMLNGPNLFAMGVIPSVKVLDARKFKVKDILNLNPDGETLTSGNETFKIGSRAIKLIKEANEKGLLDLALKNPAKTVAGLSQRTAFGVPGFSAFTPFPRF